MTTHTFSTTVRGHECDVEFNWYDAGAEPECEIMRVYPKGRPKIILETRHLEIVALEKEIMEQYRKNLKKDKE